MKRTTLLIVIVGLSIGLASLAGSSYLIPAATERSIYDFANVLQPDRLKEMESIIQRVEKQTGVEMAVVTVNSLRGQRASVSQTEPFAAALFNQWGIGHKNVNNGVLVLVSLKDRLLRFEFGSDFVPEDLGMVVGKYENGVLPLMAASHYSDGVFAATMLATQAAVEDVSFWWYHRVSLILLGFSLLALGGLVWAAKHNVKEGVWIGFLVFGALLVLAYLNFDPNHGKLGFGGGATNGIGLTERWPAA